MKWDAWCQHKGMLSTTAMRAYVDLVQELGGGPFQSSTNSDNNSTNEPNALEGLLYQAKQTSTSKRTSLLDASKTGKLLKQQLYLKGWPERLVQLEGDTLKSSYPTHPNR
jgi:hypothetical protein